MNTTASKETKLFSEVVDISVRLGIVLVLLVLSFQILKPFLIPVVWGIILTVAVFPACTMLAERLGGRRKMAALLTSLVMLLVIFVPCWFLADSLWQGVQAVRESSEQGVILIPKPTEKVKELPLIGSRAYQFWMLASNNLEKALEPFAPQLKAAGGWLLGAAAGIGLTILQFVFSIVVAGVLLAKSDACAPVASAISKRLDARRGLGLLKDAEITVRNVAKGILGVAFIQALLAGIGLAVAGVPGAGLWALMCLVFGIIQIGVAPVLLVAVIYLFSTASTLTASLFLVWSLIVAPLDNVLKPILLGKGAPVPMLVIFLGSLGGFLKFGLIGLFVGAVILSVAYKLLLAWLENQPGAESDMDAEPSDAKVAHLT